MYLRQPPLPSKRHYARLRSSSDLRLKNAARRSRPTIAMRRAPYSCSALLRFCGDSDRPKLQFRVSAAVNSGSTFPTKPVEHDLVGFDEKPVRREAGQRAGAALDLEDAVANPAVEVVVVAFAGDFVARRGAGELNLDEFAVQHEAADVAIDGRDAQPRRQPLCVGENLTRAERPVGGYKSLQDGGALLCLASHNPILRAVSPSLMRIHS